MESLNPEVVKLSGLFFYLRSPNRINNGFAGTSNDGDEGRNESQEYCGFGILARY